MPVLSRTQTYRVADADWSRDQPGIRAVRHAVFVQEQGISERLEWDGRDGDCRHVVALTALAGIVATGRLRPGGRIGRMAVLPAWRGRGIGRELLERLLMLALQDGLRQVHVHAQQDVAGFYLHSGFRIAGQPFVAAGITHVAMEKMLGAT